jgi:membrane-bound lytic murein transglycosylase D
LQATTHVVKASDTLYAVARQYGVTIKDLMDWNNKKDFTLTVGESLKILKR